MAYGILVPQPRIEPASPEVAARSPNHWTAREVPEYFKLKEFEKWEVQEELSDFPLKPVIKLSCER